MPMPTNSFATETILGMVRSHGASKFIGAVKSAMFNGNKPNDIRSREWFMLQRGIKNFDDSKSETTPASAWDEDKENIDKKTKELDNSADLKAYYENVKAVADKNKDSKLAKSEKQIADEKSKEVGGAKYQKEVAADKKFLNDKKEMIDKFKETLAEKYKNYSNTNNGDKTMDISKKDLTKIMSAMKTIQRHFSEDDEDEVNEVATTESVDDADSEEENIVVELPEDVALALREALNDDIDNQTSTDTDTDDVDVDVEDVDVGVDEDVDVDEGDGEEVVVTACGTDDFYRFSEAITDSIEKLNKKATQIANSVVDGYEKDYIEEFSVKDFRAFAESVSQTLENIAARVENIETKAGDDGKITTDLDPLKETGDDYEENFIAKVDESTDIANDSIVEQPETSVIAVGKTFSESNRYQKVKNFLSGNL